MIILLSLQTITTQNQPNPINSHLTTNAAQSQNPAIFETTWGGTGSDEAIGTALDSSGNIYVTGNTYSFCCASPDVFLLKFNSTGSLLWQRTWPGASQFGGGQVAIAHAIALDSASDAYIIGSIRLNYTSPTKVLLLKFDPDGNLVWQESVGGNGDNLGEAITISPSDSIYVTGTTHSVEYGTQALLVMKLTTNGTLIWQTAWTQNSRESGTAIAADSAGDIYIAGSTSLQTGILLKLNSTGDVLWQEQIGGTGITLNTLTPINALAIDPAGNGYATGSASIAYNDRPSTSGVSILKFNANGTLAWDGLLHEGSYGDAPSGNGLSVDSVGDIWVVGQSLTTDNRTGSSIPNGILLMQLESNGTLAWEMTRGTSTDVGKGVMPDSDHNLIIVGVVNEARPYSQTTLDDQLTTNDLNLQPTLGYPVTPNATISSLNILALIPPGSQVYSGQGDAYILKTQPPPPVPPSPPSVLVAQGYSSNVTLSWNPPKSSGSHSLTGYRIYRGLSAGTEKPLVNISTIRHYVDLDVRSGNTYYYYVTALNGVGESSPSNENSATVGVRIDPVLLAVPLAGVGALVILFLFQQRRRKYLRIGR